ncbi:hypothetical protein L218DRAFT_1007348 [Marasmius fiardii PR-910]|nr:hypothetical protein L218DRAFT_1007348 [Marasmius fiardii PR-910]
MPPENAPRLGAGLTLLNLFGLTSTPAQVFGTLILTSVITYSYFRYRYPCRSISSLVQVVDQATALFHQCLTSDAFQNGEHDRFRTVLQRITSRACEIASRTYGDSSGRPNTSSHCDKAWFLWKGLKDIIKCHREAQALIYDLEMCLMRTSHIRAEFELRNRRSSPQAFARSNSEVARVPDWISAGSIV